MDIVHHPQDQTERLTPVQRIALGIAIVGAVSAIAVGGYTAYGWTLLDGIYMVVITLFGVGYGEVRPVDSAGLRWLTIGLIVLGYAGAIYSASGLMRLIVDGELRQLLGVRKLQRDIEHLKQHVIVCGFGRMGSQLADALAARKRAFVVIDQDEERVKAARVLGYLAIHGNATEEEVLRTAGIERAMVLTTVLSNDVANVFITITAHGLNSALEILARAEDPTTVKKLRHVGATKIILPAAIGADRLANLILRPSAESLLRQAKLPEGLNDDLASLGLRVDELQLTHGSSLHGKTVADLQSQCQQHFLIVAVRRSDGTVVLNPAAAELLSAGDSVVILGHERDIPQLCARYALQSELPNELPVAG